MAFSEIIMIGRRYICQHALFWFCQTRLVLILSTTYANLECALRTNQKVFYAERKVEYYVLVCPWWLAKLAWLCPPTELQKFFLCGRVADNTLFFVESNTTNWIQHNWGTYLPQKIISDTHYIFLIHVSVRI